MNEETPGTSNSEDVQFDFKFIHDARHQSIEYLREELARLKRDNHPLLHSVRRKILNDRTIQADRTQRHRERAAQRAKQDRDSKETEYRFENTHRISELMEEATKRAEDMEKSMTHEYGLVDITKAIVAPLTFDSTKKTLRGRGGGLLIEPASYFNSNQNSRIPEFKLNLAFDNVRIRADLDAILNRPEARRKVYSIVAIQKPKLIIDNKSFKHGEDVYAWNTTFGNVLARLEITNDKLVHLKGSNNWDSRQITATLEDLEEGRVVINKQKGKDRTH
ncbi:hypothetical protein CRE_20315 [Caenorhabditis remanei]|uniref:Uncharacterized protein n=1 Tax=Caenorhabditis remanei TaxID=31234 RepID=E3MCQ0_CAERE|nr:hypothetical protein CRE_20315 [Caenorhabditis remanei]